MTPPNTPGSRLAPDSRHAPDSRLRAYGQFLIALFYFFLAGALARHSAHRFANDAWSPLVEQAILAFLLVFGYAGLGFALTRQRHPIAAQGLPTRRGLSREFAIGLSIGWGIAVVCVLAMALLGGIVIGVSFSVSSWGWLIADAAFFLLATLAEEVAFRGYAFQRFARATSPGGAVFGFSLLYAFVESMRPGATHSSALVAFVLAVLLSTAYLRTRALWVSWGLNFGWKASRALLFGLVVRGDSSNSPIVQGDPTGPFWLTGGGYGLDASWFALIVLLLALPVLYRATRDLDFRFNAPELIPAGIPVDLDAAARRQHEAAMAVTEPAAPALVQIAPLGSPPSPPDSGSVPESASESPQPGTGNESH